jgi:hypothetical protein
MLDRLHRPVALRYPILQDFSPFSQNRVTKEASDTMLVAATGCADAFWRASAWYLSILVDVLQQPGRNQVRRKWRK